MLSLGRAAAGAPRAGLLVAAIAGYASYPGFALAVAGVGNALGMEPRPVVAPHPAPLGHWLTIVGAAPIAEELLCRGPLLLVLRARIGAVPAVLATSAFSAALHGGPWSALAAAAGGIALAVLALASGGLALGLALHVGFNLASLACGMPPLRLALAPLPSAGAGAALLGLAWFWRQRARGEPGPRR